MIGVWNSVPHARATELHTWVCTSSMFEKAVRFSGVGCLMGGYYSSCGCRCTVCRSLDGLVVVLSWSAAVTSWLVYGARRWQGPGYLHWCCSLAKSWRPMPVSAVLGGQKLIHIVNLVAIVCHYTFCSGCARVVVCSSRCFGPPSDGCAVVPWVVLCT